MEYCIKDDQAHNHMMDDLPISSSNALGMQYFDCDIRVSEGINPSIKEKEDS